MFTDRVIIQCLGGCGGNGVVSFRREKFIPKGGPCGGNGGRGGSVIFKADPQLISLEHLKQKRLLKADSGSAGGSNRRQGKSASDLHIPVPCGTIIKDAHSQEMLFELLNPGDSALVVQGGRGGLGNFLFRSPTHQAPNISTPGKEGESLKIEIELKLIADIGLIGMPNAGKSTLFSALTAAQVKAAPYPFTTLYPNLGHLEFEDFSRYCLADIPGIIEGAHQNKGLGLEFLRHIERTQALIYVIDITSEDPFKDWEMLKNEILAYNSLILEKPFFIVLNKSDELELTQEICSQFSPYPVFPISALTGEGLSYVIDQIKALLPKKYY